MNPLRDWCIVAVKLALTLAAVGLVVYGFDGLARVQEIRTDSELRQFDLDTRLIRADLRNDALRKREAAEQIAASAPTARP